LGYVFTVWSIARLGTYLPAQRTGIALSVNRLRQLVHAEGFVVARPKHTLANNATSGNTGGLDRRLQQLKRGDSSERNL